LNDEKHGVGHQEGRQHGGIQFPNATVHGDHEKQHRCQDHDGYFLANDLPGDDQRGHERGHAKNEQYVEDVAADDIAECKVTLATPRRLYRDRQFRRAGAKGNDRQANHQRRYSGGSGQLRGASNESFCPRHEKHEAKQELQ